MAYNHLNKVNVFNLTGKVFSLANINNAYSKAFDHPDYVGIKPYIEIYLLKIKQTLPISIIAHRTSRILDCSKYKTAFSSHGDGFNIYLTCHSFATNEYLSWLACKSIKHIEIILNRKNYNFIADKDELSKKRVLPQKEAGTSNRNWSKDARDSLSIEIITSQFAKDITGLYFNNQWKKDQLKEYYDFSKYNPRLIKSQNAQNLMKTLDVYEIKMVENFKRQFFQKYYEIYNYPENESWLKDKAWRLFKLSKFKMATEILDDLISLNPHEEEYYRLKATCYLYRKDFKGAIDILNTAVFKDPNNPETWYLKANCFYKLENYSQAISAIEKALNIDENNHHYLAVKALCLFSIKEYKDSIEYFNRSLKINAQQAKSWCLKGFCQLYTLQFEKSLKAFDKALTIKPTYVDALLGKAFVLKRLEKYSEALDYFTKLHTAKPEDDYIHKCRRECILALNKPAKK